MSDISTLNGYNLKDAQARSNIGTIEGKIPSGASSSNKMATASDITAITEKIPNAASSSNKLVDTTAMNDAIGQAVSAAYKSAGNKTVAELTSSLLVAENRGKVYNMTDAGTTTADFVEGAGQPIRIGDDVGICEPTTGTFKFNLLSGFVAVDTNPTQSSANPVSSGGVYSALDEKINKSSSAGYVKNDGSIDTDLATTVDNKVDKVSGKGLSTNDYNNTAKGIVDNIQDNVIANTKLIKDTVRFSAKNKFKYNRVTVAGSEKTFPFTVNGITFTRNADNTITVGGGTASANTQAFLWLDGTIKAGDYIVNGCPSGGGSGKYDVRTDNDHKDEGNGVNVTLASDVGSTFYVILTVYNGCNLTTPITFNPMIRDADILDSTYEPYHKDVVNVLRDAKVINGKNLLPLSYYETNKKQNGLTFTVNKDGSIVVNGTATADTQLMINKELSSILITGQKYILSGCDSKDANIYLQYLEWNGSYAVANYQGDSEFVAHNGGEYTALRIFVGNGKVLNNLVFKPMIRDIAEKDSNYEPLYVPIKDDVLLIRNENTLLGAKNIIINNINTSTALAGVSLQKNEDGTLTLSGTSTESGARDLAVHKGSYFKQFGRYLKVSGGVAFKAYVALRNDSYSYTRISRGVDVVVDTNELNDNLDYHVTLGIEYANIDETGVVIKPMIRLASDSDDTYAPYAMTNKELTENKLKKSSTLLASTDDLDNIFENGFYSWINSPVHAPTATWGKMIVQADSNSTPTQFVYELNQIYIRRYGGSPASWSSWYKFVGSVVS